MSPETDIIQPLTDDLDQEENNPLTMKSSGLSLLDTIQNTKRNSLNGYILTADSLQETELNALRLNIVQQSMESRSRSIMVNVKSRVHQQLCV